MATSDLPGDIEQTKRRQAGAIPAGIGLTPDQQKAQRRQADRQAMAGNIQRSKESVGEFVGGIGDAINTAARSVGSIPLGVARGIADANVYDRPGQLGGAALEAVEASRPGPTPQQQAGAIFAHDVSRRAVDAGLAAYRDGAKNYREQQAKAALPAVDLAGPNRSGADSIGGAPAGRQQSPGQPAPGNPAQPGGLESWSRTGIGTGRDGGEIVGRMGANGVPEFSNREADVKGAGPQRAIGSVGDGIGGGLTTIRAQDPRIGMRIVHGSQSSQSSPGGVRVTVVGGGDTRMEEAADRRRMSIAGLTPTQQQAALAEKAGQRLKADELGLRGAELQQRGIEAGLDRGLREREMAGTEQLNAARQQEIGLGLRKGLMELDSQQRLADLRGQLADPGLKDDARQQLLQTYNTLMYSPKDRYMEVRGGTGANGAKAPSMVFDSASGRFVKQPSGPVEAPDTAVNFLLKNPERAADFDQKYGAGAAARYLDGLG